MAKRIGKESDIPEGVEHWPDCELCPKMCTNSLNVCMEGEGPSNAKLMILGSAPDQRDDDMNRPFMSREGEYLRDELLVQAEIPESKIRLSNATRCHPPKGRTPTIREIKNCRRYLEVEIRRVKPRVIVGMGNVPLASILRFYYKAPPEEGTAKKSEAKVSGISKWQGKRIWLQEFQCWFIPTFDAEYAMRNEFKHSKYSRNLIVKDLKRAWSLAQKELPEYKMPDTEVVRDPKRALRVIEMMNLSGRFAFDIETGGVGRANQKYVIGVSLSCSPSVGYYIPFSKRYYDNWETDLEAPGEDPKVRKALYALLNHPRHYKVMHNGAYELRILRTHGVQMNARYFDTMVGAHLLDENFGKGLKDLTWLHATFGGYDTPLEAYKDEHRIKEDYGKIPPHLLEPYAALDAVATWILYEKQSKELRHEGFLPLFEKIVMPVRRVMSDAEYHGIRVDEEQAERVREVGTKALERLEERIFDCAGGEFPLTNKGIAQVLFKDMGFTPLKETKTGYSVDKESIEYVATQPDSEIAKYLSDRSYVNTMLGTHISQALAFRWPEDGRVHTNYNVTGAGTGRTSASRPSLQNVPQDNLVRSVYVASEGCYLIEGDLKSAELAVIGALAGEETFIEAFNQGLDPHAMTYRRIYGLPSDYTPTKLERRMAKTINFGLVYGLTAIGLARRLDMTVEEAQAFMDLYFQRLPNVYKWMEKQRELVRKQGYVESVFHRRRRLPLGLSDKWGDQGRADRQAMNAPVQSTAADYTYIGLIRLDRNIRRSHLDSKIVHTVHDCGVTDTPVAEKDKMIEIFHASFETPVKVVPVRMRVDIEVNRRWGEGNESRLQEIIDKVGLTI